MAAKKKLSRVVWTTDDLKTLRKLAAQGLSGTAIASKLKRTRGATYQRAALEGVRLKSNRSKKKRK